MKICYETHLRRYSKLPKPMLIIRCQPMDHAMTYKYFGLKTVQMNRCVLSAVHDAITARRLMAIKAVMLEM